jgi:predicted DNA-binding transcriptional regulator YafY
VNQSSARSRIGRSDPIEAETDSVTSRNIDYNRGKDPSEARMISRYDMLVEVVGGDLPDWVREEPAPHAPARWHVLIVRDAEACLSVESLCPAQWHVAFIPEGGTSIDRNILKAFHSVWRCRPEQMDAIVEDFAHAVLRRALMDYDESVFRLCVEPNGPTGAEGRAYLIPGIGKDAGRAAVAALAQVGRMTGDRAQLVVAHVVESVQDWTLQAIDDGIAVIREEISAEVAAACAVHMKRTETLILAPDSNWAPAMPGSEGIAIDKSGLRAFLTTKRDARTFEGAMRGEKLKDLIRLALELSSSAEGMTLDEMAAFLKVSRRTAERQRDVIEEICGGALDRVEDGRQIRFRVSGDGIGRFATAPTAQELAELENVARAGETAGEPVRAQTLRSLKRKIQASLRSEKLRSLETDVDAQLRAEAFARQVGPHPYADPKVLMALREALLCQHTVSFKYRNDPKGSPRARTVVPYGLLLGPRYYLVAGMKRHADPALFRLDRMEAVQTTDEPGAPPADFDLKAYAERSFGVFQEEPQDVVLQFNPTAAADARAWVFHPTQSMIDKSDGSLTVRFRAGGLLQIAHHLMTWGATVAILAPDSLKQIMAEEVEALYRRHCKKRKGA